MSAIINTQRSFATKAMHQPAHRCDHLYRIICPQEWIETALKGVVANTGSRTPGIDGVTKAALSAESAKRAFVQEIEQELRERSCHPSPVRRVSIPKGQGKYRLVGISPLKDRVVPMRLKMEREPLWESAFLNCSNGCRPGRRTRDCMALLDSYINARNTSFWVIEGDICAAVESLQQDPWLTLLTRRGADRRLLGLVDGVLKAGLMQGQLFHHTAPGTPHGAIGAPVLATVYLHQWDWYGWQRYGGRHRKAKERRRPAHQGPCALMR